MADPNHYSSDADTPGLQDWKRLVQRALKGRDLAALTSRTRDGIAVEPLYPPRTDAFPVEGRGSRPWTLVQMLDDPDPERANAQALDDIAGGADGLVLRFAGAPAAAGLGLPPTDEAIRYALDGVDLATTKIRVDPHPRAPATAQALRDLVARQGVAPELADIAWGLDPIGHVLSQEQGGGGADALAALFEALRAAGFKGAPAGIDTRIFHEAGASEAQELGALLAGAVWWLRLLDQQGVSAETAVPCFEATLAVDRDQFMSIAKLRAARLLWARLLELCGAPPTTLRVHAETSRRMMARSDPHTNLLRTTIAGFSAGVAGADSLTVLPFDVALGAADAAARTLARNIQHLLMEEAHLHRVADPSAGSGLVEALTESLAAAAWGEFQAIEAEGGIVESLRLGALPQRVSRMREALRVDLQSGSAPLIGATLHRRASDGPAAILANEAHGAFRGLAPVSLEALAQAAA